MKCTLSVYDQLYTLVHQCVHIEVTANISKDITFKAVQYSTQIYMFLSELKHCSVDLMWMWICLNCSSKKACCLLRRWVVCAIHKQMFYNVISIASIETLDK